MAAAEEGKVLSLEAQSLSARVAATLQRGLNAATDDLAAAQRKDNKRSGGGGSAGATGDWGARDAGSVNNVNVAKVGIGEHETEVGEKAQEHEVDIASEGSSGEYFVQARWPQQPRQWRDESSTSGGTSTATSTGGRKSQRRWLRGGQSVSGGG